VSEGHPDKVCDRISDSIVDLYLGAEPEARVALETLATTNKVVLAGEVRGPASITHEKLIETARRAIKEIGYEQEGFHWKTASIDCLVHSQSADIARASIPPATRMKVRATRASCSAMPARRRRS
jgi:S-adenosylmethionine synthetase